MVQLTTIRTLNAKFVNSQSLVAVFVSGTSGIGQGLCIYRVCRNEQAADKIIEECKAKCPEGKYHFIRAGALSLLSNVDKAAKEIMKHQRENVTEGENPRVDLLCMSQGGLYLGARKETKEGLDLAMSMHYYTRAYFTHLLLRPLLTSTSPTGAHIISIFTAGSETNLLTHDPSLSTPGNFSFDKARSHCTFMTTSSKL